MNDHEGHLLHEVVDRAIANLIDKAWEHDALTIFAKRDHAVLEVQEIRCLCGLRHVYRENLLGGHVKPTVCGAAVVLQDYTNRCKPRSELCSEL